MIDEDETLIPFDCFGFAKCDDNHIDLDVVERALEPIESEWAGWEVT